jgi:Protein of unknown function (DUF2489)
MVTINIFLLIAAVAIVIALSVYAARLLSKVATQQKAVAAEQQAQQRVIDQRNDKIADSIRLIAKAIVEQQCELSEGAIRISRLLETLHQLGDANYPSQYPSLHELDRRLAAYPTHQAYKALKRQDRMRFDVERAKWELELKASIKQECSQLLQFNLLA